MRKVAGRLKIELSQYRDLEAFAQFGSDLDADTQRTLARGERLVATLNQDERSPMPVEEQVVQVFAATNGFLDRINADRVGEFLDGLTQRVRAEKADLLEKIAAGDWSDETQEALKSAIAEYADDFGYDLDEEGQPLVRRRRAHARPTACALDATPTPMRTARRRGRRRRRAGGGGGRRQRLTMASQRDVKNRIESVKNIRKITRAMEMVAAARLRRAEQRIARLRPYAGAIRRMTRQAAQAAGGEIAGLPILQRARRAAPVAILLVTADRGLAGAFNSQILRAGLRAAGEFEGDGQEVAFYASGRRGVSSLTFRGASRRAPTSASPSARPTPTRARSPRTSWRPTSTARSTASRSSTTATSRR